MTSEPPRSPDGAAGPADAIRRLRGRVLRADGAPGARATVAVSARRLRGSEPLGTAVTDLDGGYLVEFTRPAGPVDLQVEVSLDGTSARAVRALDGRPDTALDLTLPADRLSEYERLLADLTPLLDGTRPAELGDEDIDFLARATGREQGRIARLVGAARHAEATGQPAEVFYALLRYGHPDDLDALAQLRAEDVRRALGPPAQEPHAADGRVRAAHRTTPPPDLSAHTDALLTALRARQLAATSAESAAATVTGSAAEPATGAPSAPPLARIFALAVPDPTARERLYSAYLDRTADDDTWHTEAVAGPETGPHTDRLRLALSLAATTADHPGLVAVVLDRFDSGDLAEPRDLVTLDEHWPDLVDHAGGPPPGREAPEYAESVRAAVAAAHPTAYVAHKLAALPDHRDAPAARFLAANPDFDLVGTPVNRETVPDAEARRELAPVQRVFKIAPRFETLQALRDVGFDSAQAIARIDRSGFARRVAGQVDEEEAHALHERATRIHAEAVNLVADLRTAGHFDVPWLPARVAAVPRIPNWEELFGSADYPSVEEWQTVHGQPAYLVDLLYFLRRLGENYGTPPPTTSGDGPGADVQYARRPDQGELHQGKDNTQ
ncbi:carboxypeptidase-like regulatory domain-containing protein, partial [Streptomyces sp. NPDC055721]